MASTRNTTHYNIFDYWKDKSIDKFGNCYSGDNIDYSSTISMVDDWGEPTCYACGHSAIDYGKMDDEEKYDEALMSEGDSGLKYIYNRKDVKKYLERAHIVPRALQGNDDPSNYVLLCRRCHRDAPDIANKKLFLSWIFKRRKEGVVNHRAFVKASSILKNDYGIVFPYIINIDDALERGKINTHFGVLSEETIVYAFVQNALENKTELKEEYEKMFKFLMEERILEIKRRYNVDKPNYSDVDKAVLNTLESMLEQYNAFKTLEKMQPNT